MGYNIHDLFDDKWTIENLSKIVAVPLKPAEIIINTLELNSNSFRSYDHLTTVIQALLEIVFGMSDTQGIPEKFRCLFNIMMPKHKLTRLIYQDADHTSETIYKRRNRSSKAKPVKSTINIETIIDELHSIKSGESNFDMFTKHFKSLNNNSLLSEIIQDLITMSLGCNSMDDLISFDLLLSLLGYDKERSIQLLQYKEENGLTTIQVHEHTSKIDTTR